MKNASSVLPLLCGVLLLGVAACGGGGGGGSSKPNDVVPDYTVTISPTSASVRAGETQQFTATIAAPTNSGVTWGLYGEGNCTGAACGTITSAGLYTAPAVVPNPATVHVTATSKDSATSGAGVVVTILAGISVSLSPLSANVSVNGIQQFTASVQNTTNAAVSWSLGGSGCSGVTCGTISNTGLYTAPSAVPNPATVTVTATSQANTGKSATATVTIGGSALSKLNGHFAFLLSGFDANGPMHMAGSFVADGNGQLNNGLLDINRVTGIGSQVAFSGTYSLGADNRGELTLSSLLGTSKFRFALNADATEARMIEFDSTGTRCSGLFINQNVTTFSNSTVSGDLVLSLVGGGLHGTRLTAIGRFHSDGAGHFTNGYLDRNDGLTTPPAMSNWTGSYSISSNGRGTATLDVAGMGTLYFSFYVGYTNHTFISEPPAMFLVSMDPLSSSTPLLSGEVSQAYPGPDSNASWPSGGMLKVFTLTGLVRESGTSAIAGTFEADGAGHIQNGVFDRNGAGSVTSSSSFSGTYAIEASGRGTGTLQLSTTATLPITFYLATTDRAVVMQTSGAEAMLGRLWTMGGGGAPGDPSVLSGDYVTGPFAQSSFGMMMFTGQLHFDSASNFSGSQDISSPTANSADQLIGGTYRVGIRGRGTASLADGGEIVLYMVSLNHFLAMSIDADDLEPTVLVMRR
jgi:hypothetical protein